MGEPSTIVNPPSGTIADAYYTNNSGITALYTSPFSTSPLSTPYTSEVNFLSLTDDKSVLFYQKIGSSYFSTIEPNGTDETNIFSISSAEDAGLIMNTDASEFFYIRPNATSLFIRSTQNSGSLLSLFSSYYSSYIKKADLSKSAGGTRLAAWIERSNTTYRYYVIYDGIGSKYIVQSSISEIKDVALAHSGTEIAYITGSYIYIESLSTSFSSLQRTIYCPGATYLDYDEHKNLIASGSSIGVRTILSGQSTYSQVMSGTVKYATW